jgi:hypothetical protein
MSEIIDIDYLIDNIYSLNLKKVLKKYKLTEEFIVNYILNPNYQLTEVEKIAYEIAKEHLGSSFNIKRSNGFKEWLKKK